jgi:hypothetical protein
MIALLIGWGLGKRTAQLIAYVGLPVLLLVGAGLALDAWGDSRYRAGRADELAAWQAASDALIQKKATSAAAADRKASAAVVTFAAQQQLEKDRIDAAIENGASPVDALFPAAR